MSNKLKDELSPYLQQHSHNPVDWQPWGEDAFTKAKNENKPIFLSIGYSTCHWCHVMEKESFEDIEIANLLNEYFVSIKVDREERPDIDSVYMHICNVLTGSGGWPLTVFLTPDKFPFFAGTYFPKTTRYNRIGLKELLQKIIINWQEKNSDVLESAQEITNHIKQTLNQNNISEIGEEILHKCFEQLEFSFDRINGGFSQAPKFPIPHQISFLLSYYKNYKNEKALNMAELTLGKMYSGGIFDHIGNGFHRYSTDEMWLLPHFEKMLYDQALLIYTYTEAYQITKKEIYLEIAMKTADYCIENLLSVDGIFYSAEDADSEEIEGKYYLWDFEALKNILNEDFEEFAEYFEIKEEGNFSSFEKDHIGKNIIHLKKSIIHNETIKNCLNKLNNIRNKRIKPFKDTKCLTDWNGLIIAALAKLSQVKTCEKYLLYAEKCYKFIINNMINDDGILLHRYMEGKAGINSKLDDYSFLIWGITELYESTLNIEYLIKAKEFGLQAIDLFYDNDNGGFFISSKQDTDLIYRKKDIYDGAIPSGNSILIIYLLILSKYLDNNIFKIIAEKSLQFFSANINEYPVGYTKVINSIYYLFNKIDEFTIVYPTKSEQIDEIIDLIKTNGQYQRILTEFPINSKDKNQYIELFPHLKEKDLLNEQITIYYCRDNVCYNAITDILTLKAILT